MDVPEKVQEAPPTVTPRRSGYQHYDIYAVSNTEVISEYGELLTLDELVNRIGTSKTPILVAKHNVADFVAQCTERYGTDSRWQWKA